MAVGEALQEGLEDKVRRAPDEVRKRLLTLPRLSPEHVDLLLLTCGVVPTVAPSATARRVAARLGYPGATYASLARALDAEIPEGDTSEVAWRAHHVLAQHGKDVCHATNPACSRCSVKSSCAYQGDGPDPASRLSSPGG